MCVLLEQLQTFQRVVPSSLTFSGMLLPQKIIVSMRPSSATANLPTAVNSKLLSLLRVSGGTIRDLVSTDRSRLPQVGYLQAVLALQSASIFLDLLSTFTEAHSCLLVTKEQ